MSDSPPYGLPALLRDHLTAPLRPGALFEQKARAPAPGYLIMAANVTVFTIAMFAINAAYFAMKFPMIFSAGIAWIPTALAGIVMAVMGSFILAGLVHALALMAEGQAPYARSYQIVSLLSLIGPLQALSAWISGTWLVAPLVGACLSVIGLERLHKSQPLKTRVLVCALTLFALIGARCAVSRLEQQAALFQTLRALPQAPAQAQNHPPEPILPQSQPANPAAPQAAPSSLDMIRAPQMDAQQQAPAASYQTPAPIPKEGVDMFDSMMPMLDNPALTKGLSPRQTKQMEKLKALMRQLQQDIRKSMTPEQRAKNLMEFQQATGELMKNMPVR